MKISRRESIQHSSVNTLFLVIEDYKYIYEIREEKIQEKKK